MKKLYGIFFILLIATAAILMTTACGAEEHEHTYANRWSYDKTHHWHAAVCGHDERSDYGEHEFVTVNGNTYCEICKYGCNHEYETEIVQPTCNAGGYTEKTCNKCGDTYRENELPALGHDYEYETVTEPSLQAGGSVLGVCQNDGSHTIRISLPALGDPAYKMTVMTAPSCESEGKVSYRYTLPDGNAVTYRITVPENGHNYVNGVCTVCGKNHYYLYTKGAGTCTITAYVGPETVSLTIPSKIENRDVVRIAPYAFADNHMLETVTVPETVTLIEAGAFENCSKLKTVRLQMASVNLHETAFDGCTSLETAEIPNSAIRVFPKQTLREVTVLNGTYIDVSAFEGCNALERVNLPDTLNVIRSNAFRNCINLMSITVPAYVNAIQTNAFENCYKLVEIFNCSELSIGVGNGDQFGKLGNYAKRILSGNDGNILKEQDGFIYFTDGGETYLLHYEGSDPSLELPQSLGGASYNIYPYAFYGRTEFLRVTLPEQLLEIGENAFLNCYKLSEVYNYSPNLVVGKNEENGYVGYYSYALHNDSVKSSITVNGDFVFVSDSANHYLIKYTGGGKEIVLPEMFNGQSYHIGAHAFYGCDSLTKITVPDAVLTIGAYAFEGCGAEIEFETTSVIETIGEYAFYGYTGTSLTLPHSVTAIENYAFGNCENLQTFSLPSGLKTVGGTAFRGCTALGSVYYGGSLAEWCGIDFGTDVSGEHVTSYANPMRFANRFFVNSNAAPTEITTKITVPTSVTRIGAWQFSGFGSAVQILLHSGIDYVGYGAFSNCLNLKEITVPQNATLSGGIFAGCISLESVTLPTANVVESVDSDAFYYGFAYLFGTESEEGTYAVLQFYTQEDGMLAGEGTYYLPVSLKNVKLTGTEDKTLYALSFYNCAMIEQVELSGFEIIGANAFRFCTALKTVILPNTITEIGNEAFYGNQNEPLQIYYRGTQEAWNELTDGKDIFYDYDLVCNYAD